ncbi:MAG TPA: DctP family TRAP transporter solute-binding subunit [Geminicoccus sp.]|uniref:DctP family TRAP transporter solute-binding subunit n=1 Tax=Geminicoccus sp. TaxID=2024832 RepID=UPI002C67189A|nr:DctP family TRAP transporter solute-binding subunit [Geminicoccus sp.]HWL68870.1 DctP family TRAP transporter solute-binding subunit [Geminicoccus sp.]
MKRALLAAAAFALTLSPLVAGAQTTIRAAFGSMPAHPSYVGLQCFEKLAEERSGGSLAIELYPDRQLGEERETVEGLQLGTVDMTVVSTGPLSAFVPEVGVLDLPFVFKDSAHVYEVLDGEVGKELLAKFDDQSIVGLAWWENGWRHLTAKKAVQAPADLQGVKLRTMQNPVHIAAFQKLGAAPIPMVWGEVFTSLGQGIIDAQENPITVIYLNSLWEVQSHLILTGHVYGPHAVLFSKPIFETLSEDEQKIIREAVAECTTVARETSTKLDAEYRGLIAEKGMVVEEVDTTPFREMTKDIASTVEGIDPAMIEKIQAAGAD